MKWYIGAFKKYATFSGRARRQEYWMFVLINAIISFLLTMVLSGIATAVIMSGSNSGVFFNIPTYLYSLVLIIPALAVSVRRLHDIGKSGWFILLALIPLVNLYYIFGMLCADSQPGENQYGPNPKNDSGVAAPGGFVPQDATSNQYGGSNKN